MTKKAKASARAAARRRNIPARVQGFHSLDINTGSEKLRPEDLLQREIPGSVQDALVRARAWHRDNWFVEQVCQINTSFYNYGLKLKGLSKPDQKKLDKVWTDPEQRAELRRFIDSVWSEWCLLDTVIAFWRKANDGVASKPFLLLPEQAKYTDAMGIERLRYRTEFKKEDLMDDGKNGTQFLDPSVIQRYSSPDYILLKEDNGEFYEILTRGLKGQGFGTPRMRRVFRTLGQNESMEIGEFMYALAGRLVVRRHGIGFEVKSAANSMRQESYLWKKPKADAITAFFAAHQGGLVDTVEQFDQTHDLQWIDPDKYDAEKWNTVINRLMWWAGPAGFMLMSQKLNEYLLPIFETVAQKERERVADLCEYVIQDSYGMAVQLKWSNRCFRDMRLAWDMVVKLMEQGPLSLTTALREAGFDPDEEAALKKGEAKPDRREELIPIFDASHGGDPNHPEGAGAPRTKERSENKK